MLHLYTEKDVKKLVDRLKTEYDGVLETNRAAFEKVCEENRQLRARLLELEGEREDALGALLAASKTEKSIREEGEAAAERERRELLLLAEKCRALLLTLTQKYPDGEDTAALAAFSEELDEKLGVAQESGFCLEDVTSPKEPLDLMKLCRELGLAEDES